MSYEIRFLCQVKDSPTPIEKIAQAEPGELLTQVAYRAGVLVQQTCGGTPSCTDCKVTVKTNFDDAFEPPEGPELRLMGNVYFITHERLACQAHVKGNSTVFVPLPPGRRPDKKFSKKKNH